MRESKLQIGNSGSSGGRMRSFKAALIVALCGLCGLADGCAGRPNIRAPANTGSERIQNIAPEEMRKRVTQCVLPTYSALALNTPRTIRIEAIHSWRLPDE
jgi:hypothetical protein